PAEADQARAGVQVLQHSPKNHQGVRGDAHAEERTSDRSTKGRCTSPNELYGSSIRHGCL
ncbi:Mobile element protein, partial [uncultured Leptolyngbya sp.]